MRNPSDPVEGLTAFSGAGRRQIKKERQAQALSNKTHAIRDCFTPVLWDLSSPDRGKFSFHLTQPLSSPNYKAGGESDTSFKDQYTPRGWSNLHLLHSCSSRSVCIIDAAVPGVRWNKEKYLYHGHCNILSLPFVPVTLMMSSAMGALAKRKKEKGHK